MKTKKPKTPKLYKKGMGVANAKMLLDKTQQYIFYYHNMFFQMIGDTCLRSKIPAYQWDRIERQLLVKYGMSKHKGLYIQEEIRYDNESGCHFRDGICELYKDFLTVIDDSFKRTPEGEKAFVGKYSRKQIGFNASQCDVRVREADAEESRVQPGSTGEDNGGNGEGTGSAVREGSESAGGGMVEGEESAGGDDSGKSRGEDNKGAEDICKETV